MPPTIDPNTTKTRASISVAAYSTIPVIPEPPKPPAVLIKNSWMPVEASKASINAPIMNFIVPLSSYFAYLNIHIPPSQKFPCTDHQSAYSFLPLDSLLPLKGLSPHPQEKPPGRKCSPCPSQDGWLLSLRCPLCSYLLLHPVSGPWQQDPPQLLARPGCIPLPFLKEPVPGSASPSCLLTCH